MKHSKIKVFLISEGEKLKWKCDLSILILNQIFTMTPGYPKL